MLSFIVQFAKTIIVNKSCVFKRRRHWRGSQTRLSMSLLCIETNLACGSWSRVWLAPGGRGASTFVCLIFTFTYVPSDSSCPAARTSS